MKRDRIIEEFLELTGVDSPSLKERNMADLLSSKLEAMGLEVYEDGAGEKIGGECGNIIAKLKGDEDIPVIVLLAHMDTVGPCEGKKRIVEGDIVRSDGTTILGGDDAAGMVIAIETIRGIAEQGIRHGDVFAVFTVAEEIGLLGARNLDYEKLKADFAFVFDSGGPVGTVIYTAPSQTSIEIGVKGKAAHAGVEPEKGISAIQVFAKAVSGMKLGRIDEETTANIGLLNAGTASNVVCESLTAKAEARSLDVNKLENQIEHMEKLFTETCAEFGAQLTFKAKTEYIGYTIDKNSPVIEKMRHAAKRLGIEIILQKTGGGSDANILNENGIMAVTVAAGMFDVHSTSEYADIRVIESTIDMMIETFRDIG